MQRAGEILRSALRRVKRPEEPLDWLAAVWPLVMGKNLAAHTRPRACKEGVLEIGVTGAAWQEQLEEIAGTLRGEINRWRGSELVRWIYFVHEPVGATAQSFSSVPAKPPVRAEPDAEHNPFIRKGAQRHRAK